MDEYLSNLVKKSDVQAEESPEANPTVEEIEKGSVSEEKPVKSESKPVETKKEDKKPESVTEVKKEEKAKSQNSKLVEGKEYDIKPSRIYNVPNKRSISQLLEGRVVFVGMEPNGFSKIKYMRYGFGLVPGFIEDLESSIK